MLLRFVVFLYPRTARHSLLGLSPSRTKKSLFSMVDSFSIFAVLFEAAKAEVRLTMPPVRAFGLPMAQPWQFDLEADGGSGVC